MKGLTLLLSVLLLFTLTVVLVAINVGNHAVNVIAQQSLQPDSVTDTVMRSRETAVDETGAVANRSWLGAGVLAICLLSMGVVFFLMRGGADLLRQWRLARKRPSSRPRRMITQTPEVVSWPESSRLTSVRSLPEVQNEQMVDFSD